MRHNHRASTRRWRRSAAVLSCLVLALGAAIIRPDSATAEPVGPYDIDGVVIPDSGAQEVPDTVSPSSDANGFGSVKELGPKNGSSTKIGVIHNAATPMLDMTNPNAQVDLRRAWLDLQRDDTGDDWIYFAWERDANSGSGFISFEFMASPLPAGCDYSASETALRASCNPWANRQAGDFLILWDQSGSSTTLYKRIWTQPVQNGPLVLGGATMITAGLAKFSPDKFKGEAAINLTDEGLSDGGCQVFANVIPSTVTGNSDTADYKDTILNDLKPISTCDATLTTTPKTGAGEDIGAGGISIGSGVVEVKDSATLDLDGGSATPTGAITFTLCYLDSTPDKCVEVGSTSIAGGSYPKTVTSPSAYVTAAGDYCWSASWPGDAANGIPAATESNPDDECFTVNPVTPTMSTTAGDDVFLGGSVSDSATLGGTATQPTAAVIHTTSTSGAAANGTITFRLYGPSEDGCGSLAYTSPAVAVSGNGSYSTPDPQFVPTAVGDYHWVATYSGSSPNTSGVTHNSDCTDTDEDVVVSSVASTLSTEQSWVPNDSATLTAPSGGTMTGTVTFRFFDNGTCTGTPVWTEDRAVNGASGVEVSTTNDEAVSTSGTYSFEVSYDSTNPAQQDIGASCEETSALTIDNGDPVCSDD